MLTINEIIRNYIDIQNQLHNKTIQKNNKPTSKNDLQQINYHILIFRYFAVKTWNALPDSIRTMAGTREFLRSIRHVAF